MMMFGFTLIANWRLILVAFTELSCVRLSWILSTLSVGAGIPFICFKLIVVVVDRISNLKLEEEEEELEIIEIG